jgi:4-hydroxybenzoate polyprenyltransferase/predicted HAD superfamily phosphohydrolase YqeG
MKRFKDLVPEDFRGATVFLDIDGTLVPDGEEELAPAEAEALATLTAVSDVYLIASKGYHRVPAIAKRFGATPVVTEHMKPSKRIIEGLWVPRQVRVVIGDKVMTDGWFASRIGARFVRVTRMESGTEPPLIMMLYAADAVIWAVASLWNAFTESTFWRYVRIARPPQWGKNLLMFVPLVIAGVVNVHSLVAVFFGVIAFSASASVSYVVNDLIDREADMRSPVKRDRPIAAGLVTTYHALAYALFLAAIAILAASKVPTVIPWVMAYLVLTHVYTFYLKRFPVLELVAVSGFYVLRLLGGAAVAGIVPSSWLVLLFFFAALFAASGGRYVESTRPYPHAIVKRYPADFLKLAPIFFGMLTLFVYALAALEGGIIAWSVPIALFATTWNLRIVYRGAWSASPEERLWDSVILWGSLALILMILGMSYA